MKTGFTEDGGYGLVGSAVQNGWRLIVVVNGLKSDKERADEAKRLLEWGYRTFEARLLFAEGQTVGEAKVYRRRERQRAAGRRRADQPDGAAQHQRTHRRRESSTPARSGRRSSRASASASCGSSAATSWRSKCRSVPAESVAHAAA